MIRGSVGTLIMVAWVLLAAAALAQQADSKGETKTPKIAAIVTAYYHNSHADMLVSRLLQTTTLDGKGRRVQLQLASLYTDQVPDNDISRQLSKKHGFPIYDNVADALTLGTGQLAVDGVLLIAEHGEYPESETGQILYPKRRLFGEIVKVFEASDRVVPVFSDKHLSDNWQDAKWIYDTADRMEIPMMAGSSLPVLWRYPARDVRDSEPLEQIVAVSYHRLDTYGFHALEMVQTLAEARQGGETGVKSVRCLEGDAVWKAAERGVFDRKLLDQALATLKEHPIKPGKPIEARVKDPVLFVIDYRDGLRANVLTLNGLVAEWAAAWKYKSGKTDAALFWTQEWRPFQHFGHLLDGIEKMMHTGKPTWSVERTLLTTGVLDALLISLKQGGKPLRTPQLHIEYRHDWRWTMPPPPPPNRPIQGQ
ncbi:MAG: hypothetical protein RIC55_27015 [Pirellulaceae bacterium]